MVKKILRENANFVLPADGRPVLVLVYNTSSLQHAFVHVSGDCEIISGVTVGSGYPLLADQTYVVSGAEFTGAAIGSEDELVLRASKGEQVQVHVTKVYTAVI